MANRYDEQTTNELIMNHKKMRSEQTTGEKNPNYGNGHKIAGEKNCQYGKRGELSPNWGKKHSEETIKKMKESGKRVNGTRTPEDCKLIREGIAKNKKFFIRQIDKDTQEIIADYMFVLEAKNATGISYYRIATNNHHKYEFLKIKKDVR